MFDFSKIDDFDKHISMSIPSYDVLNDTFRALCMEFSADGSIFDIGCSTGGFLNSLNGFVSSHLVGCDPILFDGGEKNFKFINSGAHDAYKTISGWSIDVVVSMFTLQFLGRKERADALAIISDIVDLGGVALIAEKVYLTNSKISTILHRHHIQSKRKGFSDSEILDKDFDLCGSMHCASDLQLENELSEIGVFEQVWQCYNFKAFIVSSKNKYKVRKVQK